MFKTYSVLHVDCTETKQHVYTSYSVPDMFIYWYWYSFRVNKDELFKEISYLIQLENEIVQEKSNHFIVNKDTKEAIISNIGFSGYLNTGREMTITIFFLLTLVVQYTRMLEMCSGQGISIVLLSPYPNHNLPVCFVDQRILPYSHHMD